MAFPEVPASPAIIAFGLSMVRDQLSDTEILKQCCVLCIDNLLSRVPERSVDRNRDTELRKLPSPVSSCRNFNLLRDGEY